MSKEAILGAIRRGLKRGPLPADQRAMLEGRLASHPRHLIPARSQVSRPEQIALFIRNVEKEFGSVVRLPNFAAIPQAVADYLDQGQDLAGLPSRMGEFRLHALMRQAKARAVALGIDKVGFWLVLAQWVNDREDGILAAWIEDMLRPGLAKVPASLRDAVRQVLVELLGEVPLDGWPPAGTRRQAENGLGAVRT